MTIQEILDIYDKKHKDIWEVQIKKQIVNTKKRNKTYRDKMNKIRKAYKTWIK